MGLKTKLRELYSTQNVKIAGVVGTGIHAYSTVLNDEHFQDIFKDFSEGRYISGALKSAAPFMLPYVVSFYARKKAQKEAQRKIDNLEEKIASLEKLID